MQLTFKAKKILLTTSIAFGLAGGSWALAQDYDPSAQTDQQPPAQTQFSDETLESFATAYVKVSEITAQYASRMENAQDVDQAVEIRQEATDAMVEVIEDEGLDTDTYNAVANAAINDPKLGAKVQKLIQEEQQAQ